MRGTQDWKTHWIEKSRRVHGDFYCYEEVDYVSARKKVKITCPTHGSFEQTPDNHLKFSCKQCGIDRNAQRFTLDQDEVISRCVETHGSRYDYSKVQYFHWKKPVEIICAEHGPFKQRIYAHIKGARCPLCANSEHGGKYNTTYFERNPERKPLNSILYFIEFDHEGDQFQKIGVLRSKLKYRYKDYSFNEMAVISGPLFVSWNVENAFLMKYKEYAYTPSFKLCGYTECFKFPSSARDEITADIKSHWERFNHDFQATK